MSLLIGIYIIGDDQFLKPCLESIFLIPCSGEVCVHIYCNSTTIAYKQNILNSNINGYFEFIEVEVNCNWVEITNLIFKNVCKFNKYSGALLLNADTLLIHIPNEMFQTSSHYATTIIGAVQYKYDNKREVNHFTNAFYSKLLKNSSRFNDVEFVQGACMFVPRGVIVKLGEMKEQFVLFYEETEYCYRARLNNINVSVDKLFKVAHHGGGTWKASSKMNVKRDKHYLSNQLIFESIVMNKPIFKIMKNQIKNILNKKDSITISLGYYPLILIQTILKVDLIFYLISTYKSRGKPTK